jgi:hypothetical protein
MGPPPATLHAPTTVRWLAEDVWRWRIKIAGLSEEIRAALDVEGLDLPTPELRSLFSLPKDFRIQKDAGLRSLAWVGNALCLYGEWERATAGLAPLGRIPIDEYLALL